MPLISVVNTTFEVVNVDFIFYSCASAKDTISLSGIEKRLYNEMCLVTANMQKNKTGIIRLPYQVSLKDYVKEWWHNVLKWSFYATTNERLLYNICCFPVYVITHFPFHHFTVILRCTLVRTIWWRAAIFFLLMLTKNKEKKWQNGLYSKCHRIMQCFLFPAV